VQPPHVLAVGVQRDADRDLERLLPAWAGTLLLLGLVHELGAVPDRVGLGVTRNAHSAGNAGGAVEVEGEHLATALTAHGVGEVFGEVAGLLAVSDDLGADVGLAVAVPPL